MQGCLSSCLVNHSLAHQHETLVESLPLAHKRVIFTMKKKVLLLPQTYHPHIFSRYCSISPPPFATKFFRDVICTHCFPFLLFEAALNWGSSQSLHQLRAPSVSNDPHIPYKLSLPHPYSASTLTLDMVPYSTLKSISLLGFSWVLPFLFPSCFSHHSFFTSSGGSFPSCP